MRNNLAAILAIIIFIIPAPPLHSATMSDYCNTPASISSAIPPNIFLVTDVSGSMSWPAYYDWNTSGGPPGYSSTTTYEGYFTPTSNYKLVSGVWTETTDAEACTGPTWNPWGWIYQISGTCSGSKLNYALMARIDLVRWAVTGGTPTTCTGTKTFNAPYCDTELYNQPGNGSKVGSVCDASGCKIMTDSDLQFNLSYNTIQVPWSRLNSSLATTFKNFSVVPRMGGFFFSGTGVRSSGQVYVGDFTGPNSTQNQFPFMNLITSINSTIPSGGTPTGPAMWDAFNYYKQTNPQYGGIPVQQGSGDRWKNPLYVCDGGGSNCVLTSCAKNFVILLSDGQWNTPGCSISDGVSDPVQPAYQMHSGFTNAGANVSSNVNAVYTVGLFLGGTGAQAMQNIAMYGSFDKTGKTWPDSLTGYPQTTCIMNDCGSGSGSGCTALPTSSPDWDSNADNMPDTYYNASNATAIKSAILNAVLDALRRASSGTAVSMLSSSQGSGANILQAFFYPKKTFGSTEISWTSQLQNLWYYLDPYLTNPSIREDTDGDKKLKLDSDYILNFYFDTSDNSTKAKRYTSDSGGVQGSLVNTVSIDSVKNLWEAGGLLWSRDLSASPRTVYTTTNGTSLLSGNFAAANAAALQTYLQAADATEAAKIINYVLGTDQSGYRNRTVTIGASTGVWKLGDIVNSTPRSQSSGKLNSYNLDPPSGYGDTKYATFIQSNDYLSRGMAYVGANDGMLHAFKLGTLDVAQSGSQKARLCNDTDLTDGVGKCNDSDAVTDLGKESWAFIPKNALPYLKYMTDPNYCHLYYIDGPSYVFDASIAVPSTYTGNYWDAAKNAMVDGSNNLVMDSTSWRTILIGSMGLGGACRDISSTCTDCVKTPMSSVGYSSYFALDITNPASPSLLWEFSDPALGFSTSGPAIIRTGGSDKNGRWYAVFASGPTGPIDATSHQFMGRSDQNLKLFVLDLKTGQLLRTIDTGIQNAFGGSLFNSPIDTDKWNSSASGFYKDDVFYLGYVKKSGTTWTDGGVLRVTTKEDDPANGAGNWVVSTVMDGIGPVTTAIAKIQDRTNHKMWLHFGTGRYFYKTPTDIDDGDSQRKTFGIKEPCYNKNSIGDRFDNTCTDTVTLASLTDQTNSPSSSEPTYGWFTNLDASSGNYKAERIITDPLDAFNGTVYFTSFKPTADICGFGGNTHLWAVKYNSGVGAATSTQQGKAMLQVSTGSIEQKGISTLTFTDRDNRRTSAITGAPPKGQGLSIMIGPKPMKKTLHIKEK